MIMKQDGKPLSDSEKRLFITQWQDRNGYRARRQDRGHGIILWLFIFGLSLAVVWFILGILTNRI